ncbi:hypothetical protein [Hyphomicrobium nitrativorans]|uniref:hypothetical protein n=1 Tax=Hyphomicrobium nitrativorans TaxID=1427356 RepID=UPI000AD56BCC|nr:hypothetical protein [Hyphomicrobium nitrativorans]
MRPSSTRGESVESVSRKAPRANSYFGGRSVPIWPHIEPDPSKTTTAGPVPSVSVADEGRGKARSAARAISGQVRRVKTGIEEGIRF